RLHIVCSHLDAIRGMGVDQYTAILVNSPDRIQTISMRAHARDKAIAGFEERAHLAQVELTLVRQCVPASTHTRRVSIQQIEDKALKVGRPRYVHRRAGGRVSLSGRAWPVNTC